MNDATQVLRNEHDSILLLLDSVEQFSNSLQAGASVAAQTLSGIVEFLRGYADRFHHSKEEDVLFPALEKKGMPASGGPIGVMLMEHEQGRAFIREMAEAAKAYEGGDKRAVQQWADAALNYTALLRDHISKENNILFVMAERLLSDAEQQQLLTVFRDVEQSKAGAGTGEHLQQLMNKLLGEMNAVAAK
jgi:hemerythrin-like domain-containing protein